MLPLTALPNLYAYSIALRLTVGSAPGNPRDVGQVKEFGSTAYV